MDAKVEQFLLELPEEKRVVAMQLREIFLSVSPRISEAIKWRQLTFMYKGNLAFIYTYKTTAYMNLGFFKGTELDDPDTLLEGSGKGMRHIKVYTEKDIPVSRLKKWVKQAMLLQEAV